MKDVLFFIGALGRGGMERQMTILMDGLVNRGYRVKLVTFLPIPDAYKYDSRIERLTFESQNKIITILKLFYFFHFGLGKNDVIISFGRLSCKVCILTNLFHRFKFIAGERNFSLREDHNGKLILNLFRMADAVVTNSFSQKQFLESNFSFLKEKLHCVTNYTDTQAFHPMPIKKTGDIDGTIIGVFARLNPQKNCFKMIDAISLLKQNSNCNFVVKWYGGTCDKGEKNYSREVSNYIKSAGLERIFLLLPPVNQVAEDINKCDAICLPSLFEGFSNSISEAICCGKPVLASDVSDNHIMVEHGVNGFLFNPESPEDIAEKVLTFIKLTSDQKANMGIRSRKKAEQLFNLETFIDKYEEIIQNI